MTQCSYKCRWAQPRLGFGKSYDEPVGDLVDSHCQACSAWTDETVCATVQFSVRRWHVQTKHFTRTTCWHANRFRHTPQVERSMLMVHIPKPSWWGIPLLKDRDGTLKKNRDGSTFPLNQMVENEHEGLGRNYPYLGEKLAPSLFFGAASLFFWCSSARLWL